jgi:two-component system, cell cycle sensor histidine kinase and response regulator CckA
MDTSRILVVEDESVVALDLRSRLAALGYDVCGAVARGEEALAQVEASHPDLVLMDIRLKGAMDGIAAAEDIRRRWRLPVVYLTAYAEDSTLERAKLTEPFGYVIKPFEDRELKSVIEMALYKHAAEQRLRESEQRYATTLRSIGDGVIATDRQGRVTLMNPVAEALTGWPEAEASGRPLSEVFRIINETTRQAVDNPVARVLRENGVVGLANHTVLISREGREFPIEDGAAPIHDDAGAISGTVLVFQDGTRRREKEAELRRIEWMLSPKSPAPSGDVVTGPSYGDLTALNTSRVILDAVGPGVLQDIVSDYLDLLETSTAVYERNGDYALGIFASGWCRFLDQAARHRCHTPDDGEALRGGRWLCHESCWTDCSRVSIERGDATDIECAGGLRLYAVPIRAGDEIVGSINFGYGDPPRDPVRQRELAATYGVSEEELRTRAAAYQTRPPFIIEMAKRRLGASARLIGEIVGRKRADDERERLQAQLAQGQKMESVGRLAGGVAHDFNNMLQAILGNVDLALQDVPPGSPARESLEEIQKSAERSADLTRQLLAFARRQAIVPVVLNLNNTVAGMANMLRRLIGEQIELTWSLGADLGLVRLDPSQIDQVLVNLTVNARDAIGGAGHVTIETDNVALGRASVAAHPDCAPGEYVMLAVSDTGPGMDEEARAHLFEPFFTTKAVGKGTGLGLATVFGIVQQNGGFIDVDSEQGRGTSVKIYFPRAAGAVAAATVPPALSLRGTETILLAEDEAQVLHLGRRILEQWGYTVLAAPTPDTALIVAAEHPGRIHLLITDVVMPGMNGRDLRDRLLALRPDLKCLFISGYTDDVIAHHGLVEDGVLFLQKPFTIQALAHMVRTALA